MGSGWVRGCKKLSKKHMISFDNNGKFIRKLERKDVPIPFDLDSPTNGSNEEETQGFGILVTLSPPRGPSLC